ncbi:DUF4130 domain-containing protein, partial [Massilia oculi]|uniref:DUF4130 domain-containing protein n=1 Tax=Massilia oculi TaxID=945844 RepID=UPI0028AAA4DA
MNADAAAALAATAVANVRAGQPLLVDGFTAWRAVARELLRAGVPPETVTWGAPGADLFSGAPACQAAAHNGGDLLATQAVEQEPSNATTPRPHVPRSLMEMLQTAACYRDHDRWAFLYRVIWRWQQGEHDVQSPADPDGQRLHAMVKAVRREVHDMHAYIRFRERPIEAGAPHFVAWFQPAHDVLPQVAE